MATTNPLKNILTPDQFQKCINFYEADQRLNHNDRATIASQLQSIAIKSNLIGYTSGFGTLVAGNYYSGKYFFKKTKENPSSFPNSNVANVWKNMEYQNVGTYTLYYLRTTFNPMFIIRDPRTCSDEALIDAKQNGHFTDSIGLGHTDSTGQKHPLSAWDRVKLHHGGDINK
ncbi:hypothetical protein I9W82_002122 [Candida metapsilosis]|uniref:Uncharacterized protein n=1 Tax=Candida metapsilosis TaxID=273372 RepID=A0A8H7ZJU8_9ASCO|nr:hypothetical protein I9W82_002122 [Candida metapsilosis]